MADEAKTTAAAPQPMPALTRREFLNYAWLSSLGFVFLVGFGGMTSLGHASFLGVAAYISALLTSRYGFAHGPAAVVADGRCVRLRQHPTTAAATIGARRVPAYRSSSG